LRAGGEFHRVDGAKRGPAPAHDMPIWVGAAGPRMLRLLARKADGWLPSYAWAKREGLAEGNAVIDAEATMVGRDPREIRRLVNIGGRFQDVHTEAFHGPPTAWADDILELAVEEGVGTFILASDDPATITTFATEVMPAVRAGFDTRRAARGATQPTD
jgi:alkanesulfonate monooxygenase SsuD/methylene tetrahydromethanopterin reductase-like flavin-dependent oxidoreductase (luciferase family)